MKNSSKEIKSYTEIRGWMLLTKKIDDLQHAGNNGYKDILSEEYAFDATVPNHAEVRVGDVVFIWNGSSSEGVSVIEEIKTRKVTKLIYQCPSCRKSTIKKRKTLSPEYRCSSCGDEFGSPNLKEKEVQEYSASYQPGWTSLTEFSGAECRGFAISPKSQHSIREINLNKLENALGPDRFGSAYAYRRRLKNLPGGHVLATVQIRIGQKEFRKNLLEQYGVQCAVTGKSCEAVLDAAHLYSFAKEPKHHDNGGLLLRKDIHALFDKGLLAINPTNLTIDIVKELNELPQYANLNNKSLYVDLTEGHKRWLVLHWEQHRTAL